MPRTVFISYAADDRKFAGKLASELISDGFRVSTDLTLGIGGNFLSLLGDAIGGSDALVVLMSSNYSSSNWHLAEISMAFKGAKKILPVRIGPGGEFPRAISMLNAIDGRKGPKAAATAIAKALR